MNDINPMDLLARLSRVADAARAYFDGYCQDEAADDGPEFTGCSAEQHEAARELHDALVDYSSEELDAFARGIGRRAVGLDHVGPKQEPHN